jgi:hypothetical protein
VRSLLKKKGGEKVKGKRGDERGDRKKKKIECKIQKEKNILSMIFIFQ